jgi:hypothetical protein
MDSVSNQSDVVRNIDKRVGYSIGNITELLLFLKSQGQFH